MNTDIVFGIVLDAETLAWLRDYFQLDIDLMKLYDDWSTRDPVFRKLRDRFSGIRMLRQDPWENLVSITQMVNALCKRYSPALVSVPPPGSAESETYYPFPPPSLLAAPEVGSVLRGLAFGYRGPFIQRTAEMLVNAHTSGSAQGGREAAELWLITLREMDTNVARDELLKFIGVGRKVADCVLLMSMDKKEVIPVDTHVHQIAIKHYGLRGSSSVKASMTPKLYDEVNAKLANVWGDYAGWAHSVLFTADLKSFSSYGLPSPTPYTASGDTPTIRKVAQMAVAMLPSPSLTPSPSLASKKRSRRTGPQAANLISSDELPVLSGCEGTSLTEAHIGDDTSLADRVKKRRRVGPTVSAAR
ncbi:hypothetical protein HWV62_15193 [Athelia sp. TMB]|nr:hypothetical protein HWV62_15193 [Athelia sp. TMB]